MKLACLYAILLVFLCGELHSQNLDSLLVVARNTKDDSLSIIKMNVAGYYYLFRDQDKGVAILKEARNKAFEKKQYYCQVECTNLQGVYHALTENPDSARVYYEKAARMSRKSKFPNLEVRSVNNLGMLEWNSGNLNEALRLFFEALRLNEKVPPGLMRTSDSAMQNNIGLIYQELHIYDKALEYHKLAYKDRQQKRTRMELAASCNNLGICYERLGNTAEAEKYYKEGISFAKEYNPAEYYKLLENYSGILVDREQYPEAEKLLLEILDRPESITLTNRSRLGIFSELTNIYVNLLQPEKAIEYGKQGLAVIEEDPELKFYAADLYLDLSRAYYMNNEVDRGHTYSKKFSEATNNRFTAENAKGIADMEVRYETEKKEKLIAEGRLRLLQAEALTAVKEAQLMKSEAESGKKEKLIAENRVKLLRAEADAAGKEKVIAQNRAALLQSEADARKKNQMFMIAISFILFLSVIGYLLFRQQRLKRRQMEKEFELKSALAQIESQNRLQEQRLSISRDLHDNIGAQLTFIISSLDNLKYRLTENIPAAGNKLEGISSFTQQTIIELRDTIWAMNTKHITFEDLRARIGNFIEKAREADESIDFRFTIDPALMNVELSSVTGMNIYRTIQEAVNNAIKHSEAAKMEITVTDAQDSISIDMRDDGRGFDQAGTLAGNGLRNMEKRIEGIGGSFSLSAAPMEGTHIAIHLPKRAQSA